MNHLCLNNDVDLNIRTGPRRVLNIYANHRRPDVCSRRAGTLRPKNVRQLKHNARLVDVHIDLMLRSSPSENTSEVEHCQYQNDTDYDRKSGHRSAPSSSIRMNVLFYDSVRHLTPLSRAALPRWFRLLHFGNSRAAFSSLVTYTRKLRFLRDTVSRQVT